MVVEISPTGREKVPANVTSIKSSYACDVGDRTACNPRFIRETGEITQCCHARICLTDSPDMSAKISLSAHSGIGRGCAVCVTRRTGNQHTRM